MKVVHAVPAVNQEASGPSYSVRRLCDSLRDIEVDVTLVSLDWGPLADPPSYMKTFPLGLGPLKLGRSPKMNRWLQAAAATGAVAVMHGHGMWQMNSVYPAWAAKRHQLQLVQSPRGAFSRWAMRHGSSAKRIFWPLIQSPALAKVTCFHATSEEEHLDIRRLGFRQPVAVIPNGIDVPALPSRTQGKRTVLFLGRVHVVKGLDMLLRAWKSVQEKFPDWRLVIAGDDRGYHGETGYLGEIKEMARGLALQRVEFVGALYGAMKMQAYRDADLYVLPSRSENFGMTVAEALSMSTPCLVAKGAPWGGLSPNNAGWWVDIGVEPLIAGLTEALAAPPDVLARKGACGRLWVEKDFAWPAIASMMKDTYAWLCDKSLPVPTWVHMTEEL